MQIIKGVSVVNHNEKILNSDVYIKNNQIAKIVKKGGRGERTVIPGFINSHVHGFLGKDAMDQKKESLEFMSQAVVKYGTTSFYPTFMTSSVQKMEKALFEGSLAKGQGAKIQGFNVEGPFVSKTKKGAHDERFILPFNQGVLEGFQKKAKNLIRKITFAPECAKKEDVQKTLELNIIPSIGHTSANLKTCDLFVEAGATSFTHLWNGMTGVENRNPGAVQSALLSGKNVFLEMIVDFVHVDKKTITLSVKTKGVDNIIAVTDAISCAKLPDGEYFSGGLPVTKRGDHIFLKGTKSIAGSSASMYDVFKNLLRLKYPLQDVVKMTSYNCAKHFQMDKVGVVKENYLADLIVLNQRWEIDDVYVNGEIKHQSSNKWRGVESGTS